jgi:glutamate--cysteine ligase
MVPHLVTALTGPINELEQRLLDTMSSIERWFRLEWMEHSPPFYTSVDVRNAGFKLAPVDTDFYPTGWNHLTEAMLPLAVQAVQAAIEKICPQARNLLIIPDNHTSDPFYRSNLEQLQRIFRMAGLNVRLGSINPAQTQTSSWELPNGERTVLEPVVRDKGRLVLPHFEPCTILLNTDLASGIPGILEDLHEQFLLPPLHASWSTRRKSTHFKVYEEIAKRFGKLIGVDPWLITPLFDKSSNIDLGSPQGVDALQTHVEAMLTKIKRKYKDYGISAKPFVVVKADNRGSSAGIMSVRDSKEVPLWLQNAKNSGLALTQGAQELIVQEGVLTNERINHAVAEPVVYLMDRYVVGGFYRIHAERGANEDLSAPGSSYVPLAFADSTHLPQPGVRPGASAPNRFYMYGVIGRLAMLAASYELEATDPQAELYD